MSNETTTTTLYEKKNWIERITRWSVKALYPIRFIQNVISCCFLTIPLLNAMNTIYQMKFAMNKLCDCLEFFFFNIIVPKHSINMFEKKKTKSWDYSMLNPLRYHPSHFSQSSNLYNVIWELLLWITLRSIPFNIKWHSSTKLPTTPLERPISFLLVGSCCCYSC